MHSAKQTLAFLQPVKLKHLVVWIAGLALVVIANTSCTCIGSTPGLTSPLSPLESPVDLPTEGYGLPEGAQLVGAQYTGDFDNDDQLELVTGYKSKSGGGIIVSDIMEDGFNPIWQEEIPKELTPVDFYMQDLNGDNVSELLLLAESNDTIQQNLFVYMWEQPSYVLLKPLGGPLDGRSAFLSLYWPPYLDDPDFSGTTEIIVFMENEANTEMLSAVVYEWNGTEFRYSTNFIIPSRFKPADQQESSNCPGGRAF